MPWPGQALTTHMHTRHVRIDSTTCMMCPLWHKIILKPEKNIIFLKNGKKVNSVENLKIL